MDFLCPRYFQPWEQGLPDASNPTKKLDAVAYFSYRRQKFARRSHAGRRGVPPQYQLNSMPLTWTRAPLCLAVFSTRPALKIHGGSSRPDRPNLGPALPLWWAPACPLSKMRSVGHAKYDGPTGPRETDYSGVLDKKRLPTDRNSHLKESPRAMAPIFCPILGKKTPTQLPDGSDCSRVPCPRNFSAARRGQRSTPPVVPASPAAPNRRGEPRLPGDVVVDVHQSSVPGLLLEDL